LESNSFADSLRLDSIAALRSLATAKPSCWSRDVQQLCWPSRLVGRSRPCLRIRPTAVLIRWRLRNKHAFGYRSRRAPQRLLGRGHSFLRSLPFRTSPRITSFRVDHRGFCDSFRKRKFGLATIGRCLRRKLLGPRLFIFCRSFWRRPHLVFHHSMRCGVCREAPILLPRRNPWAKHREV
jgi:hypothetical protein